MICEGGPFVFAFRGFLGLIYFGFGLYWLYVVGSDYLLIYSV
jgi:hypothetical protein